MFLGVALIAFSAQSSDANHILASPTFGSCAPCKGIGHNQSMFLTENWFLVLQTLLGIALVLLFLRWYEPRMVFYPHIPTRELEHAPDEIGLSYENVELRTSDGLRIHGWFIPCPSDSPTGLTLLFLHGNAGNISHRLSKCQTFSDLGLDVFLIDYRGYGQSEGRPDERGTYHDADAAYEYLVQQRSVAPDRIVVYGESLGTGVAVDLASRMPVGGVILEAAFTSVADVAQRLFWFLPVRPFVRNRYESLRKISRINAPLLLLHSREDEMFRISHAQRLLNAADGPKQLVELRGKHAEAFCDSVDTCSTEIRSFLANLQH